MPKDDTRPVVAVTEGDVDPLKIVASALCKAAGMDPEGGRRIGYGWRNHADDARELLAALGQTQAEAAARVGRLEKALREIWLEASETIPPDGKDAAYHALGLVMQIARLALNNEGAGA
jgi:hypothetical protein